MKVRKEWVNSLDADERWKSPVTLLLTDSEGNLYKSIDLNEGNHYSAEDNFISCGLAKIENGELVIYEQGHDFMLTEPEEYAYYWDLDSQIYRPMIIDAQLTMLVKVDAPTGMGNHTYYVNQGTKYYKIGDGTYQAISTGDSAAAITATNIRRSNLNLCASRINGYVLYPGETFSYNEVVGERTEEAGFLPAPAYVNGDVKDEIGGGACQVSSTLYAATAFAFLETVDRSCHVFPVNYMQMGTDATVTIPKEGKSIDFKFRNNKNFPIKIVTDFNDEERTISVEIWGTLEDDDYMPVEFDNTYGWTYDYDRFIDPAYPDREGYTIKFLVDIYNGTEDDGRFYYRTITHRQVIDQEGPPPGDRSGGDCCGGYDPQSRRARQVCHGHVL